MIDKKLYHILISRYYDNVYNVCLSLLHDRHAAEDCTQEVFLLVFRKREKLDLSDNISSWLYRAARNTAKEYRRKHTEIPAELPGDTSSAPDAENGFSEQINEIYSILGKEDAELIIEYCETDNKEREELAARHGMSVNALYQKIIRLRKKLKEKMHN